MWRPIISAGTISAIAVLKLRPSGSATLSVGKSSSRIGGTPGICPITLQALAFAMLCRDETRFQQFLRNIAILNDS